MNPDRVEEDPIAAAVVGHDAIGSAHLHGGVVARRAGATEMNVGVVGPAHHRPGFRDDKFARRPLPLELFEHVGTRHAPPAQQARIAGDVGFRLAHAGILRDDAAAEKFFMTAAGRGQSPLVTPCGPL